MPFESVVSEKTGNDAKAMHNVIYLQCHGEQHIVLQLRVRG